MATAVVVYFYGFLFFHVHAEEKAVFSAVLFSAVKDADADVAATGSGSLSLSQLSDNQIPH